MQPIPAASAARTDPSGSSAASSIVATANVAVPEVGTVTCHVPAAA